MPEDAYAKYIEDLQRNLIASDQLDIDTLRKCWSACHTLSVAELISSSVESVVIPAMERMATIPVPVESHLFQSAASGAMRVIQVLDKKRPWKNYEFCRIAACCTGENRPFAAMIIR